MARYVLAGSMFSREARAYLVKKMGNKYKDERNDNPITFGLKCAFDAGRACERREIAKIISSLIESEVAEK